MSRTFAIIALLFLVSSVHAEEKCSSLWPKTLQVGSVVLNAGTSQIIIDGNLESFWSPGMESRQEWQIIDRQHGEEFAKSDLAAWTLNDGDYMAILDEQGEVQFSGYYKELVEKKLVSAAQTELEVNSPQLFKDAEMTELALETNAFKVMFADNMRAVVLHHVAYHERSQLRLANSGLRMIIAKEKAKRSVVIDGIEIPLGLGESSFEALLIAAPFMDIDGAKSNPGVEAVVLALLLDVDGVIQDAEVFDHLYLLDADGRLLAETEVGNPHHPIGSATTVEQKIELIKRTAKVIVIRAK